MKKVDFNDYSDNYNEVMKEQHSKFGDITYYSKYKVDILKSMKNFSSNLNILEFGCGIGNNLPHIINTFKNSNVYAYDISLDSLKIAKDKNPSLKIISKDDFVKNENFFDIIFIAGVFHHIELNKRDEVSKELFKLLNKRGILLVFEHNPYNPLTRHMVNTCEFDKDAILLEKRNLIKLFLNNNFLLEKSKYTLFIPPKLKSFSFIEKFIGFLPLGGQYYVVMKKND